MQLTVSSTKRRYSLRRIHATLPLIIVADNQDGYLLYLLRENLSFSVLAMSYFSPQTLLCKLTDIF